MHGRIVHNNIKNVHLENEWGKFLFYGSQI